MPHGPKMTATGDGKNLIMTYEKSVYSFRCDGQNDCYWQTEEHQLDISRRWHIMMTIPSSLVENCNCQLDARPCGCKDPVPNVDCEECVDGYWRTTDTGCKSK